MSFRKIPPECHLHWFGYSALSDGNEQFNGANGATVAVFWHLAMQYLHMNDPRDYLAELLVG